MATKAIAIWALALNYTSLSTPVLDIATKSIYNWAGCAIGGYDQAAPVAALAAVTPFLGSQGNSTIFGNGMLVDAQTAALINGVASHADDYDDTHRDNPIHPSGPVLSALFAVAEWKAPVLGEDFVTAFIAGVEAECKLGVSVYPAHYELGWHITSTVGSIGAAVAVGKLLGLNTTQMQQAISIASVQVTGMHDSFGTDTKPFHVGRASQNGMMAALLAQAGLSGALNGLEADKGWTHVVSTQENLKAEVDTLGKTWEISLNTFKPYPCDRIIHAAIDGWIQLRAQALEKGLNIADIIRVGARTNPMVLFLTDKPNITTGVEGKFSVYHVAAVALLYGEATPTQFTDEVVRNATVAALREKVTVVNDETVTEHEASVTVEFADGTKLEYHVEHALGSFENPLDDKFLKTKFIEQVTRSIGQAKAEKAFSAYIGIANATDVGALGRSYRT
ncbi:hypothetical protein PG999_001550 [Apiospora kogelbergensis]|uniref:2-methylcitrate dehydratase PrpD n=1 Tax=Apiospora kogelbergensis TaxID=1337665 RepID=A0AAW0R5X1_9PEZI